MNILYIGKITVGVVLFSLLVGGVLYFMGELDDPPCGQIQTKSLVLDPESNSVKIENEEYLSYNDGFITVMAVYCGYEEENEYVIVQTDSVSNVQKIMIGENVEISGESFLLEETNCEDETNKYLILKKE